jgi:hypothetical protein
MLDRCRSIHAAEVEEADLLDESRDEEDLYPMTFTVLGPLRIVSAPILDDIYATLPDGNAVKLSWVDDRGMNPFTSLVVGDTIICSSADQFVGTEYIQNSYLVGADVFRLDGDHGFVKMN